MQEICCLIWERLQYVDDCTQEQMLYVCYKIFFPQKHQFLSLTQGPLNRFLLEVRFHKIITVFCCIIEHS